MSLSLQPYRFFKLVLIGLFLLLFIPISSKAQNKKESLEKQYQKIQEEIKNIETLIATTKNEKQNSINQLNAITTKIETRQGLISNINAQIQFLEKSIVEKQEVIKSLEKDIEELKADYALMINNAYKNKFGTHPLHFIFSAESFNQAIQRFTYLSSYAKTRKNQSELIEKTKADLAAKIIKIEEEKAAKTVYLEEEIKQRDVLKFEKEQKNTLISKLQSNESELKNQVKEKNATAEKLNAEIEKIIAESIKKSKEASSTGTLNLTPEEKQLSTNFVSNMGKLPWPVEKGFVISKFGKHQHPTLPSVYTNNNGVDIQTEENAAVRALFNGTVVNSFYLPSTQNSVIIKHGEYFTVYSNLKVVDVKAGDKIKTKQAIGTAFTQDGLTKVHIEVWKGTQKSNPMLWLAK